MYLVTMEIQRRIQRGDHVHARVCEHAALLSHLEKRQNVIEFGVILRELLACLSEFRE